MATRALPMLLLLACDEGRDTSRQESGTVDESGATETGDTHPDDSTNESTPTRQGPAVILLVGDGMGFQHVAGASLYQTGTLGALTMETAPVQGRLRTASLSGLTDSAAAATALATGSKTHNAALGLDGESNAVETLVEHARIQGMATGVITTDSLTGATPAAFLVHVASRYDTVGIATALPAGLPDVLFGGGRIEVEPWLDAEVIDLVFTPEDLATIEGNRPLVGLFSNEIFPYVSDGYGTEPTLADMTDAALDRLEDDPEGFFLMIEGARIDHASHSNLSGVHLETAALDDAVVRVLTRAEAWGDRDVTIIVTADHECGGISVGTTGVAGELPETRWRLGDHTNADVPVYGWGEAAEVLAGQRLDNLWIHAVLAAALDADDVVAPSIPRLVDGELDDLGGPIVTQVHDTSFGAGVHQLDGLRVTADEDGLWIGIDGVFDEYSDTVLVLLDLDWGAGTGVGADLVLDDLDGRSDALLGTFIPAITLPGLGFDAALVNIGTTDVRADELYDEGGLRLFHPPYGDAGNLWWMDAIVSFDDGNVAFDDATAPDAAGTGQTTGGLEARLPWTSLAPQGLPADGTTIAVFVVMTDTTGQRVSNQALPPFAAADEPDVTAIPVSSVVLLAVDAAGVATGPAVLNP